MTVPKNPVHAHKSVLLSCSVKQAVGTSVTSWCHKNSYSARFTMQSFRIWFLLYFYSTSMKNSWAVFFLHELRQTEFFLSPYDERIRILSKSDVFKPTETFSQHSLAPVFSQLILWRFFLPYSHLGSLWLILLGCLQEKFQENARSDIYGHFAFSRVSPSGKHSGKGSGPQCRSECSTFGPLNTLLLSSVYNQLCTLHTNRLTLQRMQFRRTCRSVTVHHGRNGTAVWQDGKSSMGELGQGGRSRGPFVTGAF